MLFLTKYDNAKWLYTKVEIKPNEKPIQHCSIFFDIR